MHIFGLFDGENQIGFQCFANYVPGKTHIMHSNRTVIHPDYVGFGLGIKMVNICSAYLKEKYDYRIMAKFSSIPMYKNRLNDPKWALKTVARNIKKNKFSKNMSRENKFRHKIKTYSFEYVG